MASIRPLGCCGGAIGHRRAAKSLVDTAGEVGTRRSFGGVSRWTHRRIVGDAAAVPQRKLLMDTVGTRRAPRWGE